MCVYCYFNEAVKVTKTKTRKQKFYGLNTKKLRTKCIANIRNLFTFKGYHKLSL